MPIWSVDFETWLIRPALTAPPPVCFSFAKSDAPDDAGVVPAHEAGPLLESLLTSETLVGVNIAFDMAVALAWGVASKESIFGAYEAGRILDLGVQERIAEIGGWTTRKELSLASLARTYGLGELEKGDVRTSYEPLYLRPLSDYSEAQIAYARQDATAGARIWTRQRERHGERVNLPDVAELSRKAFWLRLVSAWGMRTDPARTSDLARECAAHVADLRALAIESGLVRADGSRDMRALRARVAEAYDGDPPMTAEPRKRTSAKPFVPQVRTDAATLEESGDPLLETLAEYGEWSAVQNKDLIFLQEGARVPIHTKFGIADTTRTTSSRPNLQNIRRKEGIRECFVPRAGNCLITVDHRGLELCTLAQCCVSLLGRWDMAGKINRGEDLHCHVGADILRVPYAEIVERIHAKDKAAKLARQAAKVVNFGRPGGMAAPTLRLYAKQGYGLDLSLDQCEGLIESWNRANPDGLAFLRYVRTLQRGQRFDLVIPGTTIARNQTTYCSAANCHFQGLGAALEARIGWEITREIHTDPHSPLACARVVNFIHDEFVLEAPIGPHSAVARRIREIMISGAKPFLPDVAIDVEIGAMLFWTKEAVSHWDGDRLTIHGRD